MTDGIIQNVFRKYYRQLEFHKRLSLDTKDFKTIEQELIDEIKKTIPNSCAKFANAGGDIFYSDGEEEILRLLIGDNQE